MDLHVRVGFPRSLAMSAPLRCGTISAGARKFRFEHKGEPPISTACCFVMDTFSLSRFCDDYAKYMQGGARKASQIVIPADLHTSHYFCIVDGEITFMNRSSHAAWLEENGMEAYWTQG